MWFPYSQNYICEFSDLGTKLEHFLIGDLGNSKNEIFGAEGNLFENLSFEKRSINLFKK